MIRSRQHVNLGADDIQLITTRPVSLSRGESTETIGREDEQLSGVIDLSEAETIDLTVDDSEIQRSPLKAGEYALASIRISDEMILYNTFIEVQEMEIFNYTINFILVKAIARDSQGNTILRGIPFTRNRNLANRLPKKLNEVCEILHLDHEGPQDNPALVDASVTSFVKVRQLIKTNAAWPVHSNNQFGEITNNIERQRVLEEMGRLYCRWQFTIISVTQRGVVKPVEEVLRTFSEKEVEPDYHISDEKLRTNWRGGKSPTSSRNTSSHRRQEVKYTLFDSFSGAGGVSCGAQMAGFRISHAIDNASDVWPTYETNFPDARLFRGSIYDYIVTQHRDVRTDILHLSPPCQFFSPAHTRQSSNDDTNTSALFGCADLIAKIKPRLITLEETFGIMHDQHRAYFNALVHSITRIGYSVRWKVVRLCTWGSAQDRKRLIIVGAAPGESLPPLPRATHSEHGTDGTKKFNTMRQALAGIRSGDNLHDIDSVKRYSPAKRAYDPNCLAGTLTTSGTDFSYPDGTRDFTLREFAALQGFPRHHRFLGGRTSIKRQIGNAFPPNTVQVLYEHLKTWLMKQDGTSTTPDLDMVIIDGPEIRVADHILVDDSDDDSVCETRRGTSVESYSSSDESLLRDIQDVLDDDDDVVMVDRPDKIIDLTIM